MTEAVRAIQALVPDTDTKAAEKRAAIARMAVVLAVPRRGRATADDAPAAMWRKLQKDERHG